MTDPEFADATYIEPITPEAVEKILLARESATARRSTRCCPRLGGQTGLNTAMSCYDQGIFTQVRRADDRRESRRHPPR